MKMWTKFLPMSNLLTMDRRFTILKAIIESFITSAEPVGSKFLLENYDFEVSSATIRNEMSLLEKQGFIYQPYTSAGRVPTSRGFRIYVDELMGTIHESALEQKDQAALDISRRSAEDAIYQTVSLLSRSTSNVSFATIPHLKKSYYLGLSNMLKSPEFQRSIEAYTVIKILEDTEQFIEVLGSLPIDRTIKVFIGEENILPEIQSCSMIASEFEVPGIGKGIIGILGPMRMNYAYNMGALEAVRVELEG